jgi:hypothetical protein
MKAGGIMNNTPALIKPDRANQIGSFVWLIVRKFLQELRKINWKKISIFAWKVFKIVLLKTAAAIGIMIGYCATAIARSSLNEHSNSVEDDEDDDDFDLEGRSGLGHSLNRCRPNLERD